MITGCSTQESRGSAKAMGLLEVSGQEVTRSLQKAE